MSGVATAVSRFILKNAVDGVVGANLFAKTMDCVRINSHLQIQFNMLNKNDIFIQLRFLGSLGFNPLPTSPCQGRS
jgi:hypothetical protein